MTRSRVVTVAVVMQIAIGLTASGIALAASTNNPRWSTCVMKAGGKFTDSLCAKAGAGEFEALALGEGESLEVSGEANGIHQLKPSVGGATIICTKLKVKAGANIKGSKAPNSGTATETIEYSECEVEKSPECKINGEASKKAKISTKPLKNTLAYETKAAAEKEEAGPTVTVFEPAEGKVFGEFELSGTCPVTGKVKVEGSSVAQNVEAESHKEAHELNAPATAITKYFVNEAGKTVEKKAEIKAFGVKATFIGRCIIIIIGGRIWWIICF